MFYEPGKTEHGLPWDPFKSCVIPRPIGWISTLDTGGTANLAPFSQFQNLTFDPPYVMFAANQNSDGRRKDSTHNAEQTGEFVWNMATYALRDAVNASSAEVPANVDEFELAGLTKAPSRLVKPPRVADSPVQFECVYHTTLRLPGNPPLGTFDIVIGRVVAVHIKDEFITPEGKLDVLKMRPLARLGYYDYTSIESVFEMRMPGGPDALVVKGLEGKLGAGR